jgi:hypothetical protein
VPPISPTIIVYMRPFEDNDELNAHIDWCLSRELFVLRRVRVTGSDRRKPEGGVRHRDLKEWWKAGAAEEKASNSKGEATENERVWYYENHVQL